MPEKDERNKKTHLWERDADSRAWNVLDLGTAGLSSERNLLQSVFIEELGLCDFAKARDDRARDDGQLLLPPNFSISEAFF